jgi:predicted secreted protein
VGVSVEALCDETYSRLDAQKRGGDGSALCRELLMHIYLFFRQVRQHSDFAIVYLFKYCFVI